jgi:hypothetical protein
MQGKLPFAVLAAVTLAACGGGGSGTTPPPAAGATVQVNLGDGPADRLLAVGLTVDAISLVDANGSTVSVLTAPRPVEMMHLMGTVRPIAVTRVPQGTYTAATMTLGAATMTYIDATTAQPVQMRVLGPMTANVALAPALTVGTTPMVVNLDMNMAASIAIGAGGSVSMSPVMTARMNPPVLGSHDPEDGGMHGLTGVASAVTGGTFTLTMLQGMPGLSLAAGPGTQFMGMGGMGMMANGMLLTVDATRQPDGTWMAERVHSRMGAGGAMAAGVVTSLTGSPPTQLVLVMHDGAGNGMLPSNLAGTATININDATSFAIDTDGVDLGNLPFAPRFDRATLSRGQRVEALSSSPMMQGGGMGGMMGGATLTATLLRLEQQGLRGTVSGYSASGSQATFTLALPTDSAFARLTGASAVTVHRQGNTQLRGLTAVGDGATVVVRGLLFFDGSAFRLVASRLVGA